MIVSRAAVLGSPVAHSLSPLIHNAGYAAAGLAQWQYSAHECHREQLAGFLASLDPSWAGLSLTMPLKQEVLTQAHEVSPMAQALGAANTLVLTGGRRIADNTDAPGIADALATNGMVAAHQVAVLGAGGTARAALGAAASLGAEEVVVYARRREAIRELDSVAQRLGVRLVSADWSQASQCELADLVISTVPKGTADGLKVAWRPHTVLFDVVYDPWPTPLALSAQRHGCVVVGGLELLLAQAVRQFELFTDVAAPVSAMRRALLQYQSH